jgi:hypothetical protein
MQNKHFNTGRFIAMWLFACITLILLFSACFITFNIDHDCAGHDCAVCQQLKTCSDIMKQLGICLYTFSFAIMAFAASWLYSLLSMNHDKKETTLVRLKVRLDI